MNLLWDRAIEKARLYGVRLDGVWMHVGTAEAVKEAEDFLADLAPA
jgi:MurNAc alpha-1-phosphate uridylyltransferase